MRVIFSSSSSWPLSDRLYTMCVSCVFSLAWIDSKLFSCSWWYYQHCISNYLLFIRIWSKVFKRTVLQNARISRSKFSSRKHRHKMLRNFPQIRTTRKVGHQLILKDDIDGSSSEDDSDSGKPLHFS